MTICGDFNFPNIDWIADIAISTVPLHTVDFAHFTAHNGLSKLVKEPTLASNFLDLQLVSDPLAVYNVSVGSPFSTSDHCVIMWNTWFPLMQSNLNFTSHDFKRADFNMISQFLGSIDWVNLFISVPPNDVNGLWLIFKSVIMQAIALHVPKRTHSRKHTPHYPLYIQRAIKRKLFLWRKRQLTGDKARYVMQAYKCKQLVTKYHAHRERKLLARNSVSAFYKHVNAKMSTSRGGVAPIIVNNNTLISDSDKACALNAYFSSIFSPRVVTTLSLSGVDKPISNDVDFSQAVVYKALTNSKRTLSSGPGDIPSIFWAKLAAVLVLSISIIFSALNHFAILPGEWKSARIMPLFKKGDPSVVGNYRPISLTSTLCKVMETIIKDNLLSHAISNKIINHNQHSFIPGRSTCSQLLETQYDWCSGLDEGGIYVIMINFRKAFDVVPHNKLITKLHN